MSRPARFWFWTVIIAAIFIFGAWRLIDKLDFGTGEALLYSGALAVVIWVVGLRFVIGNRGPLPGKKLRNPYLTTPAEFE